MQHIVVHDIIHSDKAKTVEQALAIIQHIRKSMTPAEAVEFDFSNITWVTSMFVDRLIRALHTFYSHENFHNKVDFVGVEATNRMFTTLWESAIEKADGLATA